MHDSLVQEMAQPWPPQPPAASAVAMMTIALLPFGDVFDDFLDSIGVSLEAFCTEMTGGWLFGYIEALRLAGVRTVLVLVSDQVAAPTRFAHTPTGAIVWVLPPLGLYHALRHQISEATGPTTTKEAIDNALRLRSILSAALGEVLPYLATPLSGLARILRREGCDAILCQEYEYPRFDVCVLLGRLLRLPVFATFQGGDFQRGHLERLLRPLALRASAGLIIATEAEFRRVRVRYRPTLAKLGRIFNPLDARFYGGVDRDEARLALGIAPVARVAVWHGRVAIHQKGLDLLLEAWELVRRERPGRDLQLLLVGTGEDAEGLRRRLATGAPLGIVWVDRYIHDRNAIRRYLAAADVYAFASRHEGFPVAPIEAMACGLPVVATAAQGIPDILEGGEAAGGLIVPRGDSAAFARALGRVLDDEAWGRQLGERARARVAMAFSLQAVGAQLRAFLEMGAAGKRADRRKPVPAEKNIHSGVPGDPR